MIQTWMCSCTPHVLFSMAKCSYAAELTQKTPPRWRNGVFCEREKLRSLIAVVIGLVGAFDGHADVVSLGGTEGCELGTNFIQVEAGDLFIEVLRQNLDFTCFVRVLIFPEIDLGEGLVGKAIRHHK